MAQTLIQRVRGQLSSKFDDFFQDSDILDNLNEAQKTVASYAIKLELDQPEGGRSVRALDLLRKQHIAQGLVFTKERFAYRSEIDLTTDVAKDMALLHVGGYLNGLPIKLSEITPKRKQEMAWGVLFPTPQQGYFEHRFDDDKRKLMLWTASDQDAFNVVIDYIERPADLVEASTSLVSLPDRLINAVVLKAVVQGGVQEMRENTKDFQSLYELELQTHLW